MQVRAAPAPGPVWVSAPPQVCPTFLPSHSAQATWSASPNQSLQAPLQQPFASESPWDLEQHPQDKLDLNPHPTL